MKLSKSTLAIAVTFLSITIATCKNRGSGLSSSDDGPAEPTCPATVATDVDTGNNMLGGACESCHQNNIVFAASASGPDAKPLFFQQSKFSPDRYFQLNNITQPTNRDQESFYNLLGCSVFSGDMPAAPMHFASNDAKTAALCYLRANMRKFASPAVTLRAACGFDTNLTKPDDQTLAAFVHYCGDCHQKYVNLDGTAKWPAIAGNAAAISTKLSWSSVSELAKMPPPDSPFRAELASHADVHAKMLKAVTGGDNTGGLPLDKITLPAGYSISLYAKVPRARSMVLSPSGTLFVGTGGFSNPDTKVYAVQDTQHRNVGDKVTVIASGLTNPNGVAFAGNDLYVAQPTQIIAFRNIESQISSPPKPVVIAGNFPISGGNPPSQDHIWKYLRVGPDNKLYVSSGSHANVHAPLDPFATIMRLNLDGSGREIYARGVRNSVGFDWDPNSKELWFTENGRDNLGDNIPADELNHATSAGLDFGFPYCHEGDISDPDFGNLGSCQKAVPPVVKLGPHVAALGMRFYSGSMFPADHQGGIFIAEHGSWNRTVPIGYRVTFVRLSGAKPTYETFASGWLDSNGNAWGRPVDVQVMPDGALLVSDDQAGAIYRITFNQ